MEIFAQLRYLKVPNSYGEYCTIGDITSELNHSNVIAQFCGDVRK